ncbi:hypothetical protein BDI4_1190009 [Burkholderia diffusa]|nr:hypothetical protein BDI4_1190009 [Burkholderia diffusa]
MPGRRRAHLGGFAPNREYLGVLFVIRFPIRNDLADSIAYRNAKRVIFPTDIDRMVGRAWRRDVQRYQRGV